MNYDLFKYYKECGLEGNELKTVIQEKEVDTWLKEFKGIGFLENFTGSGKTRIGCRVVERCLSKYRNDRIGIIVPTKLIKQQWEKRLGIWKDYVEIFIINSYVNLKNKINRSWNILIVDELHRICSEDAKNFNKVIQYSKADQFLGLTATLDKNKKKFLASYGIYSAFEFTLQEGYALGLVPDYNIYNISSELSKYEDEQYDEYQRNYVNTIKYFETVCPDDPYSLIFACQVLEDKQDKPLYKKINYKGQYVVKSHEQWAREVANYYNISINQVTVKANIWRNAMNGRNGVLDNSVNKLKQALDIINDNLNRKTIVFTDSINTADFLGNQVEGLRSIHSKLSDKVRDKLTESFTNNEYNQIVTVKAFDEGVDQPGLELGLNNYFTSKEIQWQQRFGRILRFDESKPNKRVNFVNQVTRKKNKLYQDEVQLKRAESSFAEQVKWITNVDEIKW